MLDSLITLLIQAGEEVAENTDGGNTQSNPWNSLFMIVALIAIFYFLMIRPQQKKQKEIRKFRESIKAGDRIITAGGIHGKVTAVKDDTFTINIANDVNIRIDKGSVYPTGTPGQEVSPKENVQ